MAYWKACITNHRMPSISKGSVPLTELNGAPTRRGGNASAANNTKRETAAVVEELFRACKQKSPCLDHIRSLVQEFPAAAGARRYRNYFPVTAAIASGASSSVVRYLVRQYPQAIEVAVIDKIPHSSESCERTTKSRNLLLHHAFWSNKGIVPLDVLKYLLQLEPRLAYVPDYTGWLPLHVACKTYCSNSGEGDSEANQKRIEIIQALVQTFPDAVLARTNDGRLPLDVLLHDACRRNSSTRNNPVSPPPPQFVLESVTLAATGYPPLHFVCRYNGSIKTIKYLLKLDPNAVFTPTLGLSRDNDIGLLPLHCACLAIASSTEEAMTTTSSSALAWTTTTTSALRVLQFLLKRNPQAASVKTVTNGETPLHCACRPSGGGHKDLSLLDIIHFLVAQCPASMASEDNKGRLPGQVLCLNSRHASCDSLYFLLRQYPHAILTMRK